MDHSPTHFVILLTKATFILALCVCGWAIIAIILVGFLDPTRTVWVFFLKIALGSGMIAMLGEWLLTRIERE